MLTPEDIEFITNLIDQRILAARPQSTKEPDYHTTNDIRRLILLHLPEFRQWAGCQPFPVSLIRHFLSTRITMRERDLDDIKCGRNNNSVCTRFDQQLGNALLHWPGGPLCKADKRGYYKFVDR
jgi:hypothetical protein